MLYIRPQVLTTTKAATGIQGDINDKHSVLGDAPSTQTPVAAYPADE
jgi:hypothetical protein